MDLPSNATLLKGWQLGLGAVIYLGAGIVPEDVVFNTAATYVDRDTTARSFSASLLPLASAKLGTLGLLNGVYCSPQLRGGECGSGSSFLTSRSTI